MQLLTGPAGSGKTFSALQALRAVLRRGETGLRVLVPTATLVQHLRNQLAREGFVFPPGMIQTISRFIEPWVADVPQISDAVLTILVERTVERLNLEELRKVAHFAGLHARLAAAIQECASAGCNLRSLREAVDPEGPANPLVRVFEEVNRVMEERKLGLRSTRLAIAAKRIADSGFGTANAIWLDGFFSLTDPELAVIRAASIHADVTVTLPSDEISFSSRTRLLEMGFQERQLTRPGSLRVNELFVAPSVEREADEIARRILEQARAGRRFHDIGIIVRTPELYVPLLRSTLERFGIPATFYFDSALMEQAAVRFIVVAMDAMLGGWQHGDALAVLKLAPGVGTSGAMDRFDFKVRERMPGTGLGPLRDLAAGVESADQRVERLLERMAGLETWRTLRLTPSEWPAQLAGLRDLYRPSRPREAENRETVLGWRTQAQALDALEDAMSDAAHAFEPSVRLALDEFWPAVKAVLRLTPLRFADQRSNVVHVLSVYEARQWELPVLFMCGLVEGQFPRYHPPDALLTEPLRRHLKQRGLRIRTAEDVEKEECFLFESGLSRATQSVVLSYPKNDARGEQNLPSLFLSPEQERIETRAVRVETVAAEPVTVATPIRSPDLLQVLQKRHAEMRPTALESYLQCPFQFFGRHTLQLEGAPLRPEERFDYLLRGSIVHQVIKEWLQSRDSVEAIFERVFAEATRRQFVVAGYRTELLRAQMLDDLCRFAAEESRLPDHQSQVEAACRFELADGVMIRCRLDRLIKTPDDRAFVVEYKYSLNTRDYAANEDRLQGPLYWLAAERGFQLNVAGVYYCSLRDSIQYAGWGEKPDWLGKGKVEPFTPQWLGTAVERGMRTARAITAGRIAPEPSDLSKCRNCDFRDACRYQVTEAATAESAR
jgi:ATP-dependent helicase/DNAse subunit B